VRLLISLSVVVIGIVEVTASCFSEAGVGCVLEEAMSLEVEGTVVEVTSIHVTISLYN
jgi:hypothetical protein